MPGLKDIGPLTVPLEINGVVVKFRGLSVNDLFDLSDRFEAVKALLENGRSGLIQLLTDSPALLRQFPDAVCAAIAVSTGERGDKEAEAAAAALPMSVQLQIIDAVKRATFREGVGPFVKMIESLSSTGDQPSEEATTSPATTATKPRRSPKQSRTPSPGAFTVDLDQTRLGRIRLAS